ncbi:tripartite tricarboxylate transporter substrate-binding protein, partial [Rhizobium ruizarguesonis]
MSEALGKPIVVDNRPGAGSSVGAAALASSPADGDTGAGVEKRLPRALRLFQIFSGRFDRRAAGN